MLRRILTLVGPGLVIASVCLGPGSVTSSSRIGSVYGYELMWVVAAGALAMAAYTGMAARFGVTQRQTLLGAVAGTYGRWFAVLIGFSAFLMSASFQFGNNLGVSMGISGILPAALQPPAGYDWVWPVGFTGICLGFLIGAKNLYRLIERIMMVLVAVMITAFVLNLFWAGPDLTETAQGFVPRIPDGAAGVAAAMIGTTFVVHAALYQSYLVQDKGWTEADLGKGRRDSIAGIAVLAILSCLIIMTSAAALHPRGIEVNSAADMAQQLQALFGPAAKVIFSIGIWAAAFSSLTMNAIMGGGLLADGLGLGKHMSERWPRLFAALIMLVGMSVATLFQGNKVYALIVAQSTTLLAAPAIVLGVFLIVNHGPTMGVHRNRLRHNVVGIFGLLLVVGMLYTSWTKLVDQIRTVREEPVAEAVEAPGD